jgi:hypothetical protein
MHMQHPAVPPLAAARLRQKTAASGNACRGNGPDKRLSVYRKIVLFRFSIVRHLI